MESLDRNNLKDMIRKADGVPFRVNKPYIAYLRLQSMRNGRVAATWYRGLLKVCDGRPCPYESQIFDEIAPLEVSLQTFTQMQRRETIGRLGFSFDVEYGVYANAIGQISSVSVEVVENSVNRKNYRLPLTIGNLPRIVWRDYWSIGASFYASYPARICYDSHNDVDLGSVCFAD